MFKIFKKFLRKNSNDSFNMTDGIQMEDRSAPESWLIRWHSRYGGFSFDTKEEIEVFLNKDSAKLFKRQLELSFKLLKYTYGTEVIMEKNV